MNSVNLVGRITKDPDLRISPSGVKLVKFTLAVDNPKSRQTDYIPCTAFEQTASFMGNFVKKGNRLAVSGHIQAQLKEDRDGRGKLYLDVIAARVDLLESKSQSAPSPNTYNAPQHTFPTPQQANQGEDEVVIVPDDLPF